MEDFSYRDVVNNAYYKDVNNYLNPFEGTWFYTNGNTTLKIVLQKMTMAANPVYYEDLLIGEYQYIENGMEKINTLSEISIVYDNQAMHNINGNLILENSSRPVCTSCTPGEKRVNLSFSDPIRELGGEIILRRITVNGQPALKAFKRTTNYFISLTEESPYKFMIVPDGEYVLIKQ